MQKVFLQLAVVLACCAIAAGLIFAGAAGVGNFLGINVLLFSVASVFLIQWLAFLPALLLRTERHFDLTGSLTYLLVTSFLLLTSSGADLRAWLVGLFVLLWAARLGIFLFTRISRAGKDDRFDEILAQPMRLFSVWTLQGLWITFTAYAAWLAIANTERVPIGWLGLLGVIFWLAGFTVEVVADRQKSMFRAKPQNANEFITTGLWSRSRHPNYFGEIVLWIGILLLAIPVLRGWQWVAVLSPVFVFLLLTRVSGIPLLERKAESRWGEREDYQRYKAETPVLFPRIFTKR